VNANGFATATVETLTAEVRCLMVGSRQVTLSVYRQLDTVDHADAEALGRVRTGDKSVPDRTIELVARRRTDGTLVRSTITPPSWRLDSTGSNVHCGLHILYRRRGEPESVTILGGEYGSHRIEYVARPTGRRPDYFRDYGHVCPVWNDGGEPFDQEQVKRHRRGECCDLSGALRDEADTEDAETLAKLIEAQNAFDTAVALPLIVLAGLR
jgi:hypothetical protein